jgi:hypothetical protein
MTRLLSDERHVEAGGLARGLVVDVGLAVAVLLAGIIILPWRVVLLVIGPARHEAEAVALCRRVFVVGIRLQIRVTVEGIEIGDGALDQRFDLLAVDLGLCR